MGIHEYLSICIASTIIVLTLFYEVSQKQSVNMDYHHMYNVIRVVRMWMYHLPTDTTSA